MQKQKRQLVYCIIKIPKVAEKIPESCMRNFPIIAPVVWCFRKLIFTYDFTEVSNIHCRHTINSIILKLLLQTINLRREKGVCLQWTGLILSDSSTTSKVKTYPQSCTQHYAFYACVIYIFVISNVTFRVYVFY